MLIWDKDEEAFNDDELQELLADSNDNVYKAAAASLNIIRANPNRLKSFAVFTYADFDTAIAHYEKLAGGASSTVSLKKVY